MGYGTITVQCPHQGHRTVGHRSTEIIQSSADRAENKAQRTLFMVCALHTVGPPPSQALCPFAPTVLVLRKALCFNNLRLDQRALHQTQVKRLNTTLDNCVGDLTPRRKPS